MIPFLYNRVSTVQAAVDMISKDADARFIAGGTNLYDLMKRNVMNPQRLVDITNLPLKKIESTNSGIRLGALALNSAVAEHETVKKEFPLLTQALNAGASPQLRNMATVAGNLMQRTRCPYFYDTALPCNKREPGSGCSALEGYNRMHAIFGWSDKCIAVYPSDMSVALAALDATVLVTGKKGDRSIPIIDFHRLPGDTPHIDNNLNRDELIIAVEVPKNPFIKNVHYVKVRDRASYAFALVSVAAGLDISNNVIKGARLAVGGVAHKPWRLTEAETLLIGKSPTQQVFQAAANIAMQSAKGFKYNSFKIKMGADAIVKALITASKTA